MKILFSLLGNKHKASSRVRGFWIAEELEGTGMDCMLRCGKGKVQFFYFAILILSHDIIIFQKTFSRYHKWLLYWAKLLGKKVFLDIDDAPSRTNSSVTLRNFSAMVQKSNGVWCGSNNLVDFVNNIDWGKAIYIPTSIKLKNYRFDPNRTQHNNKICLGWIGNGKHYKQDLIQILKPVLCAIANETPIRFKIVGSVGERELYEAFDNIDGLEIDFIDNVDWENPEAVLEAIQDFDVGLYPLLPNEFNRYKCGFKALEYMAMGIPVVGSYNLANQTIIDNDLNGCLVSSENEWYSALMELIKQPNKRKSIGLAGRKKVESEYSTGVISRKIINILDEKNYRK